MTVDNIRTQSAKDNRYENLSHSNVGVSVFLLNIQKTS
jgi:hypothetical protein